MAGLLILGALTIPTGVRRCVSMYSEIYCPSTKIVRLSPVIWFNSYYDSNLLWALGKSVSSDTPRKKHVRGQLS
jgi:hypothetical protein